MARFNPRFCATSVPGASTAPPGPLSVSGPCRTPLPAPRGHPARPGGRRTHEEGPADADPSDRVPDRHYFLLRCTAQATTPTATTAPTPTASSSASGGSWPRDW